MLFAEIVVTLHLQASMNILEHFAYNLKKSIIFRFLPMLALFRMSLNYSITINLLLHHAFMILQDKEGV